jgi:hypothetical protein
MTTTHKLKSQGQAPSAGMKYTEAWQPLTNWRVKDKQVSRSNTIMDVNHSLPIEPRTGIISRLEIY